MSKIIAKTSNHLSFFILLVIPCFIGTTRRHQLHIALNRSVCSGLGHVVLLQQFNAHQLSENWQHQAQFLTCGKCKVKHFWDAKGQPRRLHAVKRQPCGFKFLWPLQWTHTLHKYLCPDKKENWITHWGCLWVFFTVREQGMESHCTNAPLKGHPC